MAIKQSKKPDNTRMVLARGDITQVLAQRQRFAALRLDWFQLVTLLGGDDLGEDNIDEIASQLVAVKSDSGQTRGVSMPSVKVTQYIHKCDCCGDIAKIPPEQADPPRGWRPKLFIVDHGDEEYRSVLLCQACQNGKAKWLMDVMVETLKPRKRGVK